MTLSVTIRHGKGSRRSCTLPHPWAAVPVAEHGPGRGPAVELGRSGGKLRTIDCVAQSLAVGPNFSAVVLGAILAGLLGGVGPFVIVLTTVGILGLGIVVAAFATRYSGSGTVYEFVAHSLGKPAAVFAAGSYHLAAISLYTGIPIVGAVFLKLFCSAHFGFDPPWWLLALVVLVVTIVVNLIGVQVSVRTQLTIIVASLVPFLILAVAIVADGGPGREPTAVFDPGKSPRAGRSSTACCSPSSCSSASSSPRRRRGDRRAGPVDPGGDRRHDRDRRGLLRHHPVRRHDR